MLFHKLRRTKKMSQATQDQMFRTRLLSVEASEQLTTDIKDTDLQKLTNKDTQ